MTTLEVAVQTPESERQASVNGFRVLVVDDDADFRDSLALLISREGFSVAEAASIEEARLRLAEQPPDVMFVDLKLPDIATASELRAIWVAQGRANKELKLTKPS